MRALPLLVWAVLAPTSAYAQCAISGLISSSAGAPIPRAAVEVRSPALIEQVRRTTSDAAGRYRLEGLSPGIYTLRVTAAALGERRYEGLEVRAGSTATLDVRFAADGGLAETITVTAGLPAVDAVSAERRIVLPGEVVKALPTARSYNALVVLIPGVVTNSNDVVTGTATTSFPIHGGRSNEGRLALDGLTIGSPPAGNSATAVGLDVGNAEDVTFSTAGGLGEVETAGVVMNIVSKSGGNSRHGSLFVSGTGRSLQSDNVTPSLRSQGVTTQAPLTHLYDASGTFGGPIAADRLWYFVTGHSGGSRRDSTNVDYNLNAGDGSTWLYAPDPSRREYSDRSFEDGGGRLTWQMTPRQKISALVSLQSLCRTCTGATPGLAEPQRVSPEAVGVLGRPLYVSQVTWSSPWTNRLLLDAGFGSTYFGVGNFERNPNPTRDLIRVSEQCASGCAANGSIPGLVYRSQDFSTAYTGSYLWKATLSYVTGSHSVKIGYQHTLMTDDRTWTTNTQNLTFRLNNGVPNQLTESISPWVNDARAAWDGLFVQDQWTRGRLTLQGALRFDRSHSWFPQQTEGPSRFLPAAIVIPETRGIDSYKDVTPRVAAVYDTSGHGRTVLKASLGKYLEGAGVSGNYANTNPTLRLPQTTSVFGTAGVTRAWTDANYNFVPDCDLLNPAVQDLRATGGDLCGVMSNTSFGSHVLTNQFDPALLKGWNVRPSDWDLALSFQQQLGARSALEVTYTRRWFHGFSVADNLATTPSDFTAFSLTAPHDPRLPGGGGYVIPGLYDVNPDKAGQVNNLVADSSKYGQWAQHYDGLDVSLNVRVGDRFVFVGGPSLGQTVSDNCGVRARLPELATATTGTSAFGAGLANSAVTPVSPYCHVAYGILTQFNGLTTYTVPKIELQASATFQSTPGAMLAANYAAPNSAVAPSLGRSLSGNAANVTVNLIAPGTLYGDRVNQFDLRIGKLLRFGRTRTLLAFDTYNVLNSSAVLTYNTTFVPGGTWLQPLTILTPRFFKLTAQVDF